MWEIFIFFLYLSYSLFYRAHLSSTTSVVHTKDSLYVASDSDGGKEWAGIWKYDLKSKALERIVDRPANSAVIFSFFLSNHFF